MRHRRYAGPLGGVPAAGAVAREYVLTPTGDAERVTRGRQLTAAALVVLAGVAGALAYLRLRRGRIHRGPDF